MARSVFSQYHVGQWQPYSGSVRFAFPVISISETGGNRLVKRERAYRNGCKIDDTGSRETVWIIEAIFENSIQEPHADLINEGNDLYPEVLNSIIETFEMYHGVAGNLYVPTRGWMRARLDSYSRKESPEAQDCAYLSMTFVSDNEDDIDASAFSRPTVFSSAIRLANETLFSQESVGVQGPNTQSLHAFALAIESWANSPGEAAQEVDTKASQVIRACQTIRKAFMKPKYIEDIRDDRDPYPSTSAQLGISKSGGRSGRDALTDPEGADANIKLHQMEALAARSRYESTYGRPSLVTVVFARAQSLATIAAVFGQSIGDLIAANPQLDDPLYIAPRTPVKVYATSS